jgi:hypothetical protein
MGSKNHPHKNIKTLNFYIDNAAVVKNTYKITPTSRQWIRKRIKRDIDRWLEEKEEHKIIVAWIPAHKGIKGNEEANILAKAACSKMDTFKKSTRAYALRMNKEEMEREMVRHCQDRQIYMGEQTPPSMETPPTPTQLIQTEHIWQTDASPHRTHPHRQILQGLQNPKGHVMPMWRRAPNPITYPNRMPTIQQAQTPPT